MRILRNLELIGEAATHVRAEVREQHAGLPWRELICVERNSVDFSASTRKGKTGRHPGALTNRNDLPSRYGLRCWHVVGAVIGRGFL